MTKFFVIRGRVIEVRHYVNVHLWWQAPLAPTDRYEFWIRDSDNREWKFIIDTRTFVARRKHQVALIVEGELVHGMTNRTTRSAINYVRNDPPILLRAWDLLAPPAIFVGLLRAFDDTAMILFIPTLLLYFGMSLSVRWIFRFSLEKRVDRAIRNETEAWLDSNPNTPTMKFP